MKELPKMYRNSINKEINNNSKVFSTINNDRNVKEEKRKSFDIESGKYNYTVEQKIASIFNSPHYIYKIDVVVVTDSGPQNKRIVGKTKTYLITMDNEYIPISSIRDIYIAN